MNNEEFLREMHDFIDERYSIFVKYKNEITQLFDLFDEICMQNGLRYFVAYGSLLGEVRDGGQIPWDYDMDVCMPIQDVYKLIGLINGKLKGKLIFQSNFTDPDSSFYEARIGMAGFPVELVHLDIFYCIGAPIGKQLEHFRKKIRKLFVRRMHKQYLKYGEKKEDKKLAYARKFFYFLDGPFDSTKRIDKQMKRLSLKYDYETSPFIIPINFLETLFRHDDVEPIKRIEVNQRKMNFPKDEIAVLNSCYRNYKEYLPIDARFREFYDWTRMYAEFIGNTDEDYRTKL